MRKSDFEKLIEDVDYYESNDMEFVLLFSIDGKIHEVDLIMVEEKR